MATEDKAPMSGTPEESPSIAEKTEEAPKPESTKALYTGLTGDLNSIDDVINYTKNLESLMVARKASEASIAGTEPLAFKQANTVPVDDNKSETFEELIYTNPGKAKEVLKREWDIELERRKSVNDRQTQFWGEFYSKNSDLKDFEHIVQSVFKRDSAEISNGQRFPTNEAVEKHLAKEARSIVGLVKSKIGSTETRVESRQAVTISGGGTGIAPSAAPTSGPISFIDQVSKLRRRKA